MDSVYKEIVDGWGTKINVDFDEGRDRVAIQCSDSAERQGVDLDAAQLDTLIETLQQVAAKIVR